MIDVPDLDKDQIEGPRLSFDLGGVGGFNLNVGRQTFADGRLTVTQETTFTGKPLNVEQAKRIHKSGLLIQAMLSQSSTLRAGDWRRLGHVDCV